MLLLRRPRHNVVIQWLRRYSSASESPAQYEQDPCNAFLSYDADASYKAPDLQTIKNIIPSYVHHRDYKYKGLTVAVKDNICTLDFPTTCASRALEGYRSPYEATVISLLKHRGAKIVGKTNMDEFGMGSHSTNSHFGPVVQRYVAPDGEEIIYSAGGSSGGSAVAVRQRRCKGALGTDTGGSVRLPAAWCGVVGFKPSYGLVSRWGVIDYANSFDTVGFLTRSVLQANKFFCQWCFLLYLDDTDRADG
jgi:Asp-tRNA(Asn)/Glu-tRNA(Gln) amidotransferase A subunit family amidase